MGYQTNFYGSLHPENYEGFSPLHRDYLQAFFDKAHYSISRLDYQLVAHYTDLHTLCGLPLDEHCTFYIPKEGRTSRQVKPNPEVPGLYCPLIFSGDNSITINDGKSYDWQEWLSWVNDNLIKRLGYRLIGLIEWVGEDPDDRGCVNFDTLEPTVLTGVINYVDPRPLKTCK